MSKDPSKRESDHRIFLVRTALSAFGDNMMAPYIGVYAVQMGANPAEMGWLRSLQNLSGNTMQIAWGMAMDRIGRSVLFVLLGGLVGGILWLPLLFVSTPQQIIIIVVLQGLFLSMAAPSSLAVNDALVPRSKRSQGVGELYSTWMLGTIPAILISGYLMSQTRESLRAMYFLPILMAALFRGGSSLLLFPMMRREKHEVERPANPSESIFDNMRIILQNANLRRLYLISFFQGLFMAFAWPLFPITNVIVTRNNMFLIAMLSITHTAISSATYPYFGRLADRFGKKPIIMLGRIGIALVPISYALSTEPWHLITAHIFWGVFMMAESVTTAYILENAEPSSVGTSLAFYSMIYGAATFLGSLGGGYLVNELINLGYPKTNALTMGFLTAAGGRFVTGIAYGKLREEPEPPPPYPRGLGSPI